MSSLASSTSEIYELLVSLLAKCPQTIEILPGDASIYMHTEHLADIKSESSFVPFLFAEGNLGIPHKVLQKMYLHAVGVFRSARSCVSMRATQQNTDPDTSLLRSLAASSSILIIGNPCHQTALNARKHLVRLDHIDRCTELCFVASLLSSERSARVGELWYHRRWLLSFACGTQPQIVSGAESNHRLQFMSQEALRTELELASRACEVYPRNYFAWTHRLTCIRSLLSEYISGVDVVGFVLIFRNEIRGIKGWVDRHVSDYSAIHTIITLSRLAFDSGMSPLMDVVIKEDLLDHAISLVQDYPFHEALWTYIQVVLSIPGLHQAQKFQQFRDHFVQPLVHLPSSKAGTIGDLVKASLYARQFVERRVGCDST